MPHHTSEPVPSLHRAGMKSGYQKKDGSLSKKGQNALLAVSGKPLVDSGILQETISYQIFNGGL